jgi:hypothetical protein
MRVILHVTIPVEPFNAFVRDGSAGTKIKKILDEAKPEAAYFTDSDGQRSGWIIVDLADASRIPALAEPWFLTFNAKCELKIAMTAEDLAKSGIDTIGKKW